MSTAGTGSTGTARPTAPDTTGAGARWPQPAAPRWSRRLLLDPDPVKVVVTGPYGAGKTAFVRSLAESGPVRMEAHVEDQVSADKPTTTVALDFAGLDLADPRGGGQTLRVGLFGTPGRSRFEFMWRVVAEGMRVFIVLVDASHQQSRNEAMLILRTFQTMSPDVPYLVAVNRWKQDEDLDLLLLDLGMTMAERHLVHRTDVQQRHECRRLLQHAVQLVAPRAHAWEDVLADSTADLLGTR